MKHVAFPGCLVLFGSMLAFSLIGCGSDSPPSGAVSGKVTYRGAPVTKGSVLFINSDTGIGANGILDDSGNYQISSLRTGTYQVALQHPPVPSPEELERGAKAELLSIPEKFLDPQQSGLTFTLVEGENQADFNL